MIIVSQDKEKIKKYNNIITISYDINYDNDYKKSKKFWIISIDGEDMAHYKTKERAKEVLQEIINKYKAYDTLYPGNNEIAYLQKPKVYEMPEA